MQCAVECYTRNNPIPRFNGGLVCNISIIRNLFGVGVFFLILISSICLVPHKGGYILLPIFAIIMSLLFFWSSINEMLFQAAFKDWLLRADHDRVIIKLGIGKDASGRFPVAVGFAISELEIVRGIIQDRLVKISNNETAREHWAYLEFKLRGGSNAIILPTNLEKTFFGMTVKTNVVEVVDGAIRVLWQNTGFRVRPSIHNVVDYFAQYTKAELVKAADEHRSSFLTN